MNVISTLSQKPVFQAKYFSVIERTLSINNQIQTHHNVLRSPVVCVFPMTDTYDLYLISQYRYLYDSLLLEEVAGHVEPGETTLAAAKRELLEETGIKAKKWEKMTALHGSASVVKSDIHLYLARDLSLGKSQPDVDEEISLLKMPLEDAVLGVMSGKMKTSATMLGILMLDEKKRKGKI